MPTFYDGRKIALYVSIVNFLSEILIKLRLKIIFLKIRNKKPLLRRLTHPSCLIGVSIGS